MDCAGLTIKIPELRSVLLLNHAQPVVLIYINLITRLFLQHLLLLYHWTLSQRHLPLPNLFLCPMLPLMTFCCRFLVIVKLGKISIESVFERSSCKGIETHFSLFLRFGGLVSIKELFSLIFNFLLLMLDFFRDFIFSFIVFPLKFEPMLSSFLLVLKLFHQKDIRTLSILFSRFTDLLFALF